MAAEGVLRLCVGAGVQESSGMLAYACVCMCVCSCLRRVLLHPVRLRAYMCVCVRLLRVGAFVYVYDVCLFHACVRVCVCVLSLWWV